MVIRMSAGVHLKSSPNKERDYLLGVYLVGTQDLQSTKNGGKKEGEKLILG